jgi:hypothetical protein
MSSVYNLVIVGGGAAGFFAANVGVDLGLKKILIIEKSNKILSKVRISGGGRCNFTNDSPDPAGLVKNYPRGGKELLGAFTRFGVKETLDWFQKKGLQYKTENDGRMFPASNSSESIINILTAIHKSNKIELKVNSEVKSINKNNNAFELTLITNEIIHSKSVIVCSGGMSTIDKGNFLFSTKHKIIPPVPSLFTFNVPDSPLKNFMGLSIPFAGVKPETAKDFIYGPLLITHWGFSGPVILKLSSLYANEFALKKYALSFTIRWTGKNAEENFEIITKHQKEYRTQLIYNFYPFDIPKRLWQYFCFRSGIIESYNYADLSLKQLRKLSEQLANDVFIMQGKTTFKEEFVTCGGIELKEIDFKTMESKIIPGLFFAGEVLNIDGVTGGFNFQAAWTTAWHAANACNKYLNEYNY